MVNKLELKLKLKEILKERGITQRDLAELTGLTTTVISEVATNRRMSINRKHLAVIIAALDIEDLNEILYIG